MRSSPKLASNSMADTSRSLSDQLVRVPGITPAFSAALGKGLSLFTVQDLLHHFPRRHEDRTKFRQIRDVAHGEAVTLRARIVSVENVPTKSRLVLTKVAINDGSGLANLVFFNQWFLKKQFEKLKGGWIVAYGKASRSMRSGLELNEVEWETYAEDKDPLAADRIVPIYPLTEGISQARLRKVIFHALELYLPAVVERMPRSILKRHGLMPLADAYQSLHFPIDSDAIEGAKKRLIFDEFLELQLVLALRKRQLEKVPGNVFADTEAPVLELKQAFPYPLTAAQERVIEEIAVDMRSKHAMHRLVQGDVGAGKTVVAMAALTIAVRNGFQAALMAPTEILAEQHYLNIHRTMEGLGITVALLTGRLPAKEKRASLAALASGEAQIGIGTHALIQDDVAFQKLGLAVVDEQHRFGVMQRAALKSKGTMPELLVMTATPIPRTLTLTVYGDLDVSIIDQLPPGRKPVRTHWKRGNEREQVYETIRGMLKDGRQVYVICSLIEENEKLQARAATELAEFLQGEVYPEFRIGLLHGQMKSSEKEDIMTRFRDRELDLLVSTTVIEVGVDVPNASVILIEDADRFGMAQLHQLRGRVGRGSTQSYCILIGDPKSEDGVTRLQTLARTTDGFEIAEEDLRLRGPGDFYGTRQSGAQSLPFLDVIRDVPTLHEARREAFDLLAHDPALSAAEFQPLKERVRARYQKLLGVVVS